MSATVTLVIAVRNRDESLARLFASIAAQDAPPETYDVVTVNYGGSERARVLLDAAELRCASRYIAVDAPGLFNESHAKNIGIKAAGGAYPVCVNADIILPPQTITALLGAIARHGTSVIYQMQRMDCPPECDFADLSSAQPYALLACGDLQGAHRDVWARLCGYDEQMTGWGWMDIDFVLRAADAGIAQHWIPGAVIYHQYHPENPVRRNRLNIVYTQARDRAGHRQVRWGDPQGSDAASWVIEGTPGDPAPKDPKTEAVFFDGARIEGTFSRALARRLFGTDVVYAGRKTTVRTAMFCTSVVPRFGGALASLYVYRQCKAEHILTEEEPAMRTLRGGAAFVFSCMWFLAAKAVCMPLTVLREKGFKKTLRDSLRVMERSRHGQCHHTHV